MQIPKRFTEENQQEIFDAYRAGAKPRQLADDYGTKSETITAILGRFGVDVKRHRNRFSLKTEYEIAERYAAGERPSNLATEYKCAQYTIRDIAKRHGVKISPRGNRYREFSEKEITEMARRWEDGESQAAIGRQFGAHQVIVSRVLRGAGYNPKPRRRTGADNNLWRGGRVVDGHGYILIHVAPDHPYASMRNRTGYIPEHRLVMAQALGRPLASWESVHHLNGRREDNKLGNLQLRQGKHGKGIAMCCADCGSRNVVPVELSED